MQSVVDFFQRVLHLVFVAQDAELGGGDMADIAVGEMLLQKPGRFRDQRVSLGIAESVVESPHMYQLEAAHHGMPGKIGHLAQQRVGPADEIAHARQTGELVDFRSLGVGIQIALRNAGPQGLGAEFVA